MAEALTKNAKWMFGMGVGAGILVSNITRSAERALAPSFGEWGAWGIGLLAALALLAVFGLLMQLAMGGSKDSN